jgi:hypothetical protein
MLSKYMVRITFAIVCFVTAAPTWASVRMTQLSEADLQGIYSELSKSGVLPGDVLLENDMIRAVVFATPADSDSGRIGQCLMLPMDATASGEPVRFAPGPVGKWQDVEAGMVSSVAVVRMHRREERWNAELVIKLHDGSSWVDVSTVVRNTDQNEILEIPVVDEVFLPEGTKMETAGPRTAYFDQPKKNTTTAVLASTQSLNVRETEGRRYSLGTISGDPQPRSFIMSGFGLFGRKKPENRDRYQPVDASRDWHRSLRSNDDWHRLQPGEERSIDRKVISSVTITEAKTLAEAVADIKAPMVQLVPSTQRSASAATVTSSKKIVGSLRGQTVSNPAPASEPEPIDSSEEEYQPPAILAPSIQAIEDLPPPIDE